MSSKQLNRSSSISLGAYDFARRTSHDFFALIAPPNASPTISPSPSTSQNTLPATFLAPAVQSPSPSISHSPSSSQISSHVNESHSPSKRTSVEFNLFRPNGMSGRESGGFETVSTGSPYSRRESILLTTPEEKHHTFTSKNLNLQIYQNNQSPTQKREGHGSVNLSYFESPNASPQTSNPNNISNSSANNSSNNNLPSINSTALRDTTAPTRTLR
eukprot:TRINITY_DN374_c0_g1_i1.p1 TRINITY_DN374_c0_g1~~TRINITY_DN374_c0_g1_i1.p1  ORF type:complete len:216 (-),score=37.10 TRINITY_DN374_c0_g1_i1:5-652(-)